MIANPPFRFLTAAALRSAAVGLKALDQVCVEVEQPAGTVRRADVVRVSAAEVGGGKSVLLIRVAERPPAEGA